MKKNSFLILIVFLGLSISSCSKYEELSQKSEELQESSKPTIKIKKSSKNEENKADKPDPLAEALQDAKKTERELNVSGLIPSTNPEVRVRGSVRGRQDPFSIITVQPKVEVKVDETAAVKPSTNEAEKPKNITSTPTMETLKTPEKVASTQLAQNVLITGLIEFGDRIKVILQAPEETNTRYVEIGEYVANGQVLIKRIESSFPNPTVVLEENGIEVSRTVGQPIENPLEEEEQAMLPPPSSNSTITPVSWLSNYLEQKFPNSSTTR